MEIGIVIYGVATFRENGGVRFVETMCEPRTLMLVVLPINATLFALQAPPKNCSHVAHDKEGKVGVSVRTDSAQIVKAKT